MRHPVLAGQVTDALLSQPPIGRVQLLAVSQHVADPQGLHTIAKLEVVLAKIDRLVGPLSGQIQGSLGILVKALVVRLARQDQEHAVGRCLGPGPLLKFRRR